MPVAFVSTRGAPPTSLGEALLAGLAPDGGLFVPSELPRLEPRDFADCDNCVATAQVFMAPFVAGTPLQSELADIVAETYAFPIPLVSLGADAPQVLELFHGPTAAFKDVGARFLAACMARLATIDPAHPMTILVATSGDTGGAVAAAFFDRPGFDVAVLYPSGRVSARQQQQLTCWGGNVFAFEVAGNFDACQRLVKAAFADPALAERFRLSSANSINIGRLLPQSVYYANAALQHYRATGRKLSFIVPTGNLGNGLAAVLARAVGLPIGDVVLATNANKTIPDYLASGRYEARDSLATLASAMDVGNPSNMERLRYLFGEADELTQQVRAIAVGDAEIQATVRHVAEEYGMPICPHTATGFHAWQRLPATERRGVDWAIAATAHPAKFDDIVEPLLGASVPIPSALAALLDRPAHALAIPAELSALQHGLESRGR
ncbi:MAG: threonine synthase [Pseudomonadota bacterium]